VIAAQHAAAAEGAAGSIRTLALEEGVRHCLTGFAEIDSHVRGFEGVLATDFPAHLPEHFVRIGKARVPGGPQHPQGGLVVRSQFGFPVGQVAPGGRGEEGILGDGQGVGVDEGTTAHPHAGKGRHMVEEGHLEETTEAHPGQPEEPLEVPVGLGEVASAEAPSFFEHQHPVALFREAQGAHAAAESGPYDDVVPHHGPAPRYRSVNGEAYHPVGGDSI